MIFSKCGSVHVPFPLNNLEWLLLAIKVDSMLDSSYMVLHASPHALCSSISLLKHSLQSHWTLFVLICFVMPQACLILEGFSSPLVKSLPFSCQLKHYLPEKPSLTPRIATQCDLQTRSTHITWELVGNAESQAF